MNYTNGFPLGATAVFYLLDENNVIIDSISTTNSIASGSYNTGTYITTPGSGKVTYAIPQTTVENLDLTKRIMLKVSFSTDATGKVRIDADSYFDFNVRTNLKIKVEV